MKSVIMISARSSGIIQLNMKQPPCLIQRGCFVKGIKMNICKINNCNSRPVSMGYCRKHYDKNNWQKIKSRMDSGDYDIPKCRTKEYKLWIGIKQRCFNPKYPQSRYYLGRGITMCDEWKNSFDSFNKYIGKKPGSGYSIDRIDNDGNYEPGNVRWATHYQQNNNSRHNSAHPNVSFRVTTKGVIRWKPRIVVNRKQIYLGVFDTLEQAVERREQAEKRYCG